jgi:hypothetical protein
VSAWNNSKIGMRELIFSFTNSLEGRGLMERELQVEEEHTTPGIKELDRIKRKQCQGSNQDICIRTLIVLA